MHLVTLKNNPRNQLIFNLDNLFYLKINIKSYRSINPAQYFSCQRFGHSSLHCGYQPRCVKCWGPDLTKECKKTLIEKPFYTNCKGDNLANFKRCPTFLQIKASKIYPTLKQRPTTTQKLTVVPQNSNLSTNIIPTVNSVTGNKPFYAFKIINNSPLLKDTLQSIAINLQDLLISISNGNIDLQDAFITIVLAIMPFLLNEHEHKNPVLELPRRVTKAPWTTKTQTFSTSTSTPWKPVTSPINWKT